jgi:beta-glucosidase
MKKLSYRFPEKFVWGVAAASAQIEGAAWEDGKGESVWDRFSRQPGAVVNGDTLDVACDHYHRYESDAAMMRELGISNYRLSVAWPRIYPQGVGVVNEAGLDFYDRVIDALLAKGVTPWVTLFHWDLPQALEDEGGWMNRATVNAFRPYAETVVKRLSDRVQHWFTLNEMPCFIGMGYGSGEHAPGRRENRQLVHQAYHHALLAHGHAVAAVREFGGSKAQVGVVNNPSTPLPVTETETDIAAARAVYEASNGYLMAPLFRGQYPADFLERMGNDAPQVEQGDMELIAQPTDFFGLNLYAGSFVRAGKDGRPEAIPFPKQFPKGDLPWLDITPQTLYWGIRHAAEAYGVNTFYITENGGAFDNEVTGEGEILDLDRREYLRNYLIGLHRATEEDYDVRGYFQWSLMDNYEWAEGYAKRFGIVHVDYQTQKRTPKLSAHWYSRVIAENRIV